MRLLYIHDWALDSETANIIQVLHMCFSFSDLGIDVTLATPNLNGTQESPRQAIARMMNRQVSFQVRTFNKIAIGQRFSMTGGYWGVKRLLKKIDADFCALRNPVYVKLTLAKGIPTVFECHNSQLTINHRMLDYLWKRELVKSSKSTLFTKFITISSALADYWIKAGVPADKVVVLHDAVDTHQYSIVHDQESMRNKLGLPEARKIVVYTGSLYRNRGIENIVKLARLLPEVLFVVVGGPEKMKRRYNKACERERIRNVIFTGYVAHHRVKEFLFAADVLLMIWTKQVKTMDYCSPLKMFEYMAAGRIIVGQLFPTIEEVLKDGQHAYLANPDSFDDLYKKLKLALSHAYPNVMAEKARELAINNYTWQARAKAVLAHLGG